MMEHFKLYGSKLKRAAALLIAAALLLPVLPLSFSAEAVASYFACDCTMDGYIDAADARIALRMSVGLESYTAALQKVADADYDGRVAPADARLILRVSVGLERIEIRQYSFTEEELNAYVYTAGEKGPTEPVTEEPTTEEPTTQAPGKTDRRVPSQEEFPLPDIPMPTPSGKSGTFTFTSYGWGDGVGMSQYGAAEMARRGYTYDQIVRYYFTGTELVKADSYPEYTFRIDGYYDTEKLIARMVNAEIYGIVDENPEAHKEVLKAQAVVLFTLLKYHDFYTESIYEIGATKGSYDTLPQIIKDAVHEVMGEYLAQSSDPEKKPISALFFATCALRTASAKDVWGYDYPYLQAVNSPGDVNGYQFANSFTVSKEEMRRMIMDYDSSIRLSSDPSEWIEIVDHSASIDRYRGYVRKVRVGDRVLDCYFEFMDGVMSYYFWRSDYFGCSTAFYVTYTP